MALEDLPSNLITYIAGKLDVQGRNDLALTSNHKIFNAIASKAFWQQEIKRYLPYLEMTHPTEFQQQPAKLFNKTFKKRKGASGLLFDGGKIRQVFAHGDTIITDDEFYRVLAAGQGCYNTLEDKGLVEVREAFISAVLNGEEQSTSFLEYLDNHQALNLDIIMLEDLSQRPDRNNYFHLYRALQSAASVGNISTVNKLTDLYAAKLQNNIKVHVLGHLIVAHELKYSDNSAVTRLRQQWGDEIYNQAKSRSVHIALGIEKLETMDALLEKWGDELTHSDKEKSFYVAARQGNLKVLDKFMDMLGADLSLNLKMTALHSAAKLGHLSVVKRITSSLTDQDLAFNQRILSAQKTAKSNGHVEISGHLRKILDKQASKSAGLSLSVLSTMVAGFLLRKSLLTFAVAVTPINIMVTVMTKYLLNLRALFIHKNHDQAEADLEAFFNKNPAAREQREQAFDIGVLAGKSGKGYLISYTYKNAYVHYDAFYAGLEAGTYDENTLINQVTEGRNLRNS